MLNTIVIIPYRNNKDNDIRKKQLEYFIKFTAPNISKIIKDSKIIIVEQDFTEELFNRGLLINIAVNEYKNLTKYIITHDVDINPSIDLIKEYYNNDLTDNNIEGILVTKYDTLAPIIKLTTKTYIKMNGFPNDFWGWGAEDTALMQRAKYNKFNIKKHFINNYDKNIEKLFNISNISNDRNKINHENNLNKVINGNKSEEQIFKNMYSSGMHNLDYKIINRKNLNSNIEIIKVCIKKEFKYYKYSPKLRLWHRDAYLDKNINISHFYPVYAVFPRKTYKRLLRDDSIKIYNYCFSGSYKVDKKTIKNRAWIIPFIKKNFNENSYLNFTDEKTIEEHVSFGNYDRTGKIKGFVPKEHNFNERDYFDKEYYDILCKSKFCLCPAGDSFYSMRFYEAIMCKSIPIINNHIESFRTKAESKVDYKYYLADEKHVYNLDFVNHNLSIFMKYHTLKYYNDIPINNLNILNEFGEKLEINNNLIDYKNLISNSIRKDDNILEIGNTNFCYSSCLINAIIKNKTNHFLIEPNFKIIDVLENNRNNNNCKFSIVNYDNKLLLNDFYEKLNHTYDVVKNRNEKFNVLILDSIKYSNDFLNKNYEQIKDFRLIIIVIDKSIIDLNNLINNKNFNYEVLNNIIVLNNNNNNNNNN